VAELRALLVSEREKYAREYEAFKPTWPFISEEERERARQLKDLSDEEREEWLRRAIDRKLRTILAVLREARLAEAHQARLEDRIEARKKEEARNKERDQGPRAPAGGGRGGGGGHPAGRAGGGRARADRREGTRPAPAAVVALSGSAGVSPATAKSKRRGKDQKRRNEPGNRPGINKDQTSRSEDPAADLAGSTVKEAEPRVYDIVNIACLLLDKLTDAKHRERAWAWAPEHLK
jgi:hypothetical protein